MPEVNLYSGGPMSFGNKARAVTPSTTDLDPIADLVVRNEIGPVLARLAN